MHFQFRSRLLRKIHPHRRDHCKNRYRNLFVEPLEDRRLLTLFGILEPKAQDAYDAFDSTIEGLYDSDAANALQTMWSPDVDSFTLDGEGRPVALYRDNGYHVARRTESGWTPSSASCGPSPGKYEKMPLSNTHKAFSEKMRHPRPYCPDYQLRHPVRAHIAKLPEENCRGDFKRSRPTSKKIAKN